MGLFRKSPPNYIHKKRSRIIFVFLYTTVDDIDDRRLGHRVTESIEACSFKFCRCPLGRGRPLVHSRCAQPGSSSRHPEAGPMASTELRRPGSRHQQTQLLLWHYYTLLWHYYDTIMTLLWHYYCFHYNTFMTLLFSLFFVLFHLWQGFFN